MTRSSRKAIYLVGGLGGLFLLGPISFGLFGGIVALLLGEFDSSIFLVPSVLVL